MFKNIKNIIFDLGGVLLNINYQLTKQAFIKIGLSDFNNVYSKAKQTSFFDRFETGKISAENFRQELKKKLPKHITNKEIDNAWNAMLLDLPIERVDLLLKLKNNYRTFLLSNTNEIHVSAFEQICSKHYGNNLFERLFEKHYYSNKIGLRKPNANCFQHVIEENRLIPAETLFIDDSEQHIKGAIQCGLKAIHLKENETVNEILKNL
jgi:putative hydrolase of the HAD superfamily